MIPGFSVSRCTPDFKFTRVSALILRLAVILMGFTSLWLQVFLIRELLVTFSGNELVIGIFLANWLLLSAVGSFLSSRFASKSQNPCLTFTKLQFMLALFFLFVLYFVRTIKYQMGIIPGEGIALPLLFLVSFSLTLPLALLVGFQFGYACRLMAIIQTYSDLGISRAYFFEAVGSMIGGLILGQIFLLKIQSFIGVFVIALLNFGLAFLLLYHFSGVKSWRWFFALMLAGTICAIFAGIPETLNRMSRTYQWRDYEVLADGNSVYGNAILLSYQEELILVSNGIPVVTIPAANIAHTEDLIHLSLLHHRQPDQILLIGGGLGGPLNELAKHPAKKIDYVDLDPLLIELMQQHLPDSLILPFRDPRVHSIFTDARYFLQKTEERYDAIILNLPEPSSLEINRVYTREFFKLCRSRMQPDGILVYSLPGSISTMGRALCQLNHAVNAAACEVFTNAKIFPDSYNLYICSNHVLPDKKDIDKLESRWINRNIESLLISPPYLIIKSDSLRSVGFTEQISICRISAVNQDLKPIAVFYSLLHWNSIYAPFLADLLIWFEGTGTGPLMLLILIIFCLAVVLTSRSRRRHKIALVTAITGTGFAGMGVTVILVLMFQTTFGYIYHWIGFLLAAFMAGLAAGAWQADKWGKLLIITRKFILLELILIAYLVILFLATRIAYADYLPGTIQITFIIFFLLCGYLVGTQFAVAAAHFKRGDATAARSGSLIYAADLLGAWFGGIIITVICVPVFGIPETIIFLSSVKVLTLIYYFLAHRRDL